MHKFSKTHKCSKALYGGILNSKLHHLQARNTSITGTNSFSTLTLKRPPGVKFDPRAFFFFDNVSGAS
jgi:hypothetical protein